MGPPKWDHLRVVPISSMTQPHPLADLSGRPVGGLRWTLGLNQLQYAVDHPLIHGSFARTRRRQGTDPPGVKQLTQGIVIELTHPFVIELTHLV